MRYLNFKIKTVLCSFAIFLLAPVLQAQVNGGDGGGGGYDHGNGGDICEYRFKTVRDDLSAWIIKGGAVSLRLPAAITREQYVQSMLAKIQVAQVGCTDEEVFVGGAEKTCKNFVDVDGSVKIVCNRNLFMTTSESDQYVLVHHEYAGLAGFEVNSGESSRYEISEQISGYLENQIVKRLVVRPPAEAYGDPFDPASCEGPQFSEEEAAKTFPPNEQVADFATFSVYTRERQCSNTSLKGCTEWKTIQNQVRYFDENGAKKNIFIPDTGIIILVGTSDGIGIHFSTTPNKYNLTGRGLNLVCDHVSSVKQSCWTQTLPDFRTIGDFTGVVTNHCTRLAYKHEGFFADKEYYEMKNDYKSGNKLGSDLWVERETVIVSRY